MLAVAEKGEAVAGNDDPAGELDEGEVDEVVLHVFHIARAERRRAQHHVFQVFIGVMTFMRVDFAVDVAHRSPIRS